MRLCLLLVPLLLCGCIRQTEYVESAQAPVPYVPRPVLNTGNLTLQEALADRAALKRAVRAWEGTVKDYNQGVNEHNAANGYQVYPVPSPYPTLDYSTVEQPAPVSPEAAPAP